MAQDIETEEAEREETPGPSPFLAVGETGHLDPERLAPLLEAWDEAFEVRPGPFVEPVQYHVVPFETADGFGSETTLYPTGEDLADTETVVDGDYRTQLEAEDFAQYETRDDFMDVELPADGEYAPSEEAAPQYFDTEISSEASSADQYVEPGELTSLHPPVDSIAAGESEAVSAYEEVEDLMTAFEAATTLADPVKEATVLATQALEARPLESPLGEVLPFERQAGPPVVATQLTVSVRTDFTVRSGGTVEFHWRPGEPVGNAAVQVVGTAMQAVTNARGVALLNLAGLQDGDYVVRLSHNVVDQSTAEPTGPRVADPLATRPSRIYRPLDVNIRVRAGRLADAWIGPGNPHGGLGNRAQANWSGGHLPIDWKPVWMRSPMKASEVLRQATAIDLIVVHRTGGPRIGPAINTFINPHTVANAHYLIDHNGHIIKTAEDLRRANQAGTSRWRGRSGVNSFSIGIEIVNGGGSFSAAQYDALVGLLQRLQAAYPIAAHRVVGHSDIATTAGQPTLISNRRSEDPGGEFDWQMLERHGIGMVAVTTSVMGYFANVFSGALGSAPIVLRRGDRDPGPGRPAVIGGVKRPGFAGTPVSELQADLEHIGYSTRPAGGALGTFDLHTLRALDRFQRHFFSGSRKAFRAGRLGRLDALTANWVKTVRAGIP